ncbi:MAG: PAS domain S-box protein, partial [Cyclobacteriaceae bacterium]
INESFQYFDRDHDLLERAMSINSEELTSAYQRIKDDSKRKFESVFNFTGTGISIVDFEGKFLEANSRMCKITGYSMDELQRMSIRDLNHPDENARNFELLVKLKEGEIDSYTIEKKYIHKSGKIVFVIVTASLFKDIQSNKNNILGQVQDITELREERSLRVENESKFRTLVENALVGVGIFKDDQIVYSNPTLFKIFEYENQQDYIKENSNLVFERATEETKSAIHARLSSIRKGERVPDSFIGRFHTKHGSLKILEIYTKSVVISGEQCRMSMILDITEKHTVNQILAEERSRFAEIIKGTNVGTWEWNIQTGQAIFNQRWAEIIGYSLEELEPMDVNTWVRFIIEEDLRKSDELLQKHFTGELEYFEYEYRMKHKMGHWVWVLNRGKVGTWTEDGKPLLMSGSHYDITEKKEYEEKLLHANQKLEQSLTELNIVSQAKEDFLSIMSHEIRTPLNSVIGLSNLLLRRNPRDDQYEIIKTLKNSGDNLMHLVNDILDYNKIEAGKVELESINFRLSQFLSHLHASFHQMAEDKNLEFHIKADPQIPDALEGDITRLNQIFNNLISNAIKFTTQGYVSIEAHLQSKSDKTCSVVFDIKDSGTGIPNEKMKAIFKPFQQSNVDIARQYGGTGLGLSIVKGLVQMFDGKISVSSVVGKGSVFTLQLDFGISYISTAPMITKNHSDTMKSRLNILYVEDVESNRFLVQNLLDDSEMICTLAHSGEDALGKTLEKKFDVILMDIQMPNMDGYQTTDKIRSQESGKNRTTPIIAFTAEPFSEKLKNRVLGHHIQDVITKPFEIDAFIEKINMVSSASKDHGDIINFSFYERAFDNNKLKLQQIKKAVIDDIALFKKNFDSAMLQQSVEDIRAEIHKIRPILKNIGIMQLINVLDRFRLHEVYSEELKELGAIVEKKTAKVLSDLAKLPY